MGDLSAQAHNPRFKFELPSGENWLDCPFQLGQNWDKVSASEAPRKLKINPNHLLFEGGWCARQDSNLQPAD